LCLCPKVLNTVKISQEGLLMDISGDTIRDLFLRGLRTLF
jgi:hypothetical protein